MENWRQGFSSSKFWAVPPALFGAWGAYHFALDGPWYIIRATFDGHGYLFYAYTMVLWGFYGCVLVWQYGRRGLFLAVLSGLLCDIAQSFLAGLWTPLLPILTHDYGIEAILWAIGIALCFRLCHPLKLNILTWWTISVLLTWLAAQNLLIGLFGTSPSVTNLVEPITMSSWMVGFYKGVKPDDPSRDTGVQRGHAHQPDSV